MDVSVTILTNLRGSLELHLCGSRRNLVAITALHCAMRTNQWKLGFRVVVAGDVGPGPCVVTSLATQSRTVGAALRHPVVEFAVMRVFVTRGAAHVCEAKRQNFIRAACRAHLMTIGTRHSGMGASQSETGVAMLGDGKGRAMEILNRMAAFTFVLVRRGGKLPVVSILVTVQASCEFHFVNGVFPGGKMTFSTFNGNVLSTQWITRCVVLLYSEK